MFIIVKTLCNAFATRQINSYLRSPLLKFNQNIIIGRLARSLSSQHITRNIEFFTQDNRVTLSKNIVHNTNVTNDRSLLIILSWLFAKRSHVIKFVNLYMEQNFDIVLVYVKPLQLMWPLKGSKLIAMDLLTFLKQNESYQQILLHGFSVGGYVWGEVLSIIQNDTEKYNSIVNRMIGQVWDSVADFDRVSLGMSRSLFPRNRIMQNVLNANMKFYMKMCYNYSTQYYIRSSELFHKHGLRVPALLLMSKADPVATVESNLILRDLWENMGIQTYIKIFEKSPHIAHYRMYPKEYVAEIHSFLQKLNLIQNEKKIKVRL